MTMMILNLPNDLESEILARVPAKSLQELRTTCKRWNALFKDPKFVEKNKKLSKPARETMLLSNHQVYSIAGDLHNNNGDIDFTGKLSKYLYTISHCDGLILCQAKDNSSLVIWNPCTGQRKTIEPRTCYQGGDTFALGYSRCGYKILRRRYYLNEQKAWFVDWEMYELCSDSWRVLESGGTLDYWTYCNSVSLRGDSYFVASDKESGFFLMKFDFTEEKFVRLPLPFQSFDQEDSAVLSVVRDEKLAVCHQDILSLSNVMRIWVTDKVDELSWSKDFVLTVDFDQFQLPSVVNVASFLLDEEKKVALCCDVDSVEDQDRIKIYIVGENKYKQVYKDTKASWHNWPFVLTYVPSLVHIH